MSLTDFALFACAVLLALLMMILGGMMLISPPKLVGLGSWVGRMFGMRPPEIEWKGGLYLDWRLAGLLIAALGAFFARLARLMILRHTVAGPPKGASQAGRVGPAWYPLAGALVMLGLGVYTLIRARRLFCWMVERTQFKMLNGRNFSAGIMFFRLVGFLWVLVAISMIRGWFK